MSTLGRRIDALRRRLSERDICPGHVAAPSLADLRGTLRAFSPYRAERDAYRAEQDALAATPPCARCGWQPFAIYIETPGHWGQHDDDAIA